MRPSEKLRLSLLRIQEETRDEVAVWFDLLGMEVVANVLRAGHAFQFAIASSPALRRLNTGGGLGGLDVGGGLRVIVDLLDLHRVGMFVGSGGSDHGERGEGASTEGQRGGLGGHGE